MTRNGQLNQMINATAQGASFQGNIRKDGSVIIINLETSINLLGGTINGVTMFRHTPRTLGLWSYTLIHELGHATSLLYQYD